MDSSEIRRRYNQVASYYDLMEAPLDLLLFSRHRPRLVREAKGNVLEIAIGTGKNLPYYPPGCRITGADISEGMLMRAGKRAARLGLSVDLLLADGEALPFSANSFDTVVSSLASCTFPDPIKALREMARVCKPGGRIMLLEHVRSRIGPLSRFLDWLSPHWAEQSGCHLNRNTVANIRETGLEITSIESHFLGVVQLIEIAC